MNKLFSISIVFIIIFALFLSGCKKTHEGGTTKFEPVYIGGDVQGSTQATTCPAAEECPTCTKYVCESSSGTYIYASFVCPAPESAATVAVINNTGAIIGGSSNTAFFYIAVDGTLIVLPDNLPVAVTDIGETNVANAHPFKVQPGTAAIQIKKNTIYVDGVGAGRILTYCPSSTPPLIMILSLTSPLINIPNIDMTTGWCPNANGEGGNGKACSEAESMSRVGKNCP
ncbi:MAG: hypothetical protein V1647_01510 [Pseudomonadota bacterium]